MPHTIQVQFICVTTEDHVLNLPDVEVPAWFTSRQLDIGMARANSGLLSDILFSGTEVAQGCSQFHLADTLALRLVHDVESGDTILVWIAPGPVAKTRTLPRFEGLAATWKFAEPTPAAFAAIRRDDRWGFVNILAVNEPVLAYIDRVFTERDTRVQESTQESSNTCNPSDTLQSSGASA